MVFGVMETCRCTSSSASGSPLHTKVARTPEGSSCMPPIIPTSRIVAVRSVRWVHCASRIVQPSLSETLRARTQ